MNIGTRVIFDDGEHFGQTGTVVGSHYVGEANLYEIRIDYDGEIYILNEDEFYALY